MLQTQQDFASNTIQGNKVLCDTVSNQLPNVIDYFRFNRKKFYSTYKLYNEGKVKAELYANSKDILLSFTVTDVDMVGETEYKALVVDLGNDLANLAPLMCSLIPSTCSERWERLSDELMLCIMRDTLNGLTEQSCHNCNNTECIFRDTDNACYFR